MFDQNNNYSGTFYGKDRLGHTTPDPDGSDVLRPFLVNPYPAPYLPGRRRDEGHPVGAQVVLSAGYAVGLDKSAGVIPAGLKSGDTGEGGEFVLLKYGSDDVGFTYNAKTGLIVSSATEHALIGAPTEAHTTLNGGATTGTIEAATPTVLTPSDMTGLKVGQYISVVGVTGVKRIVAVGTATVTLDSAGEAVAGAAVAFATPTILGVTPTDAEIDWAKTCDLVPGGCARAIGYAIRNVFQYLGGVTVSSTTGGMTYTQNGVIPVKFRVHNYMHEMGTAIQTSMVLKFPWLGKDLSRLEALATAAGLTIGTEYTLTDYAKSFVHFLGDLGAGAGKLYRGCSVVASDAPGDAGNWRPYNSAKDSADQIVGRVIGIEHIYPIKDYADRVRTQFDRAQGFVGPFADRNPASMMMGGSATRGLDYAVNLGTNGLLRALLSKGVAGADIPKEAATYVWVGVRTL